MPSSLYGRYRTNSFTEIYGEYDTFKNEYKATVFKDAITDKYLELCYYLLYQQYGNSHIANSDENQFKYKLYAIIWSYGPIWEKKMIIQEQVRALTEDQIREGARNISDHSYNPSTELGANGEIDTVNEQDRTRVKRNLIDALASQWDVLDAKPTVEFLDKFRPLFLVITEPQAPLLYGEE